MEPVLTHRAKSVVDAARLHRARERRASGLTLVEGPDLVSDAIAAGAKVLELFGSGGRPIDGRALERLSGTKSPRGPVAVVEIPAESIDDSKNLLVSAGVSDPGNVGTMIRTAAAFGWGYAYLESSADPWSPKTIRAGGGGQFQTSVSKLSSLDELSSWTTVATVPAGGVRIAELRPARYALLIGEEASGLSDEVISGADVTATIPTSGSTESLNASIAAGIAVYELSKHSVEKSSDV